jgi:uncharacterized surface protein with fasciclin (FAS1) repeats
LLTLLQDRTGFEFNLGSLQSTAKDAAAAASAAASAASAAAAAATSATADAAAASEAAAAAAAEQAAAAAARAAAAAAAADAERAAALRAAAAAAWEKAAATAETARVNAAAAAAAAAVAAVPKPAPPPPPPAPPALASGPRAPPGHIVDILSGNPQGIYSVLLEALVRAGADATLSSVGPFTLFAPSNDAFAKALAVLKLSKDDVLALPNLGAVLSFHVVPGIVRAEDLSDGMLVASAQGAPLRFARAGNSIRVNGAAVSSANIEASNGAW